MRWLIAELRKLWGLMELQEASTKALFANGLERIAQLSQGNWVQFQASWLRICMLRQIVDSKQAFLKTIKACCCRPWTQTPGAMEFGPVEHHGICWRKNQQKSSYGHQELHQRLSLRLTVDWSGSIFKRFFSWSLPIWLTSMFCMMLATSDGSLEKESKWRSRIKMSKKELMAGHGTLGEQNDTPY